MPIAPAFDLSDSGGLRLAALRGITDLTLFGAFGTLTFCVVAVPFALPAMTVGEEEGALISLRRQSRRWNVAALATLAVWLAQTARWLTSDSGFASLLPDNTVVLTGTVFGHQVMTEIGLLFVAMLFISNRPRAAMAMTGTALAIQAAHRHAYGMHLWPLVMSEALHLLTGVAWALAMPMGTMG